MTTPDNKDDSVHHAAPANAGATGPSLDQTLHAALGYFQTQQEMARKEDRWNKIKRSLWVVIVLGLIGFQLVFYGRMLGVDGAAGSSDVATVPVHGPIAAGGAASAEKVVPLIEKACKIAGLKHLVLDINSPGGSPNESERIVAAIEQCRKDKKLKVTSVIDGVGASAGFMIAVHSDQIVAGRYSIVGSIGAIMRYVDASSAATRFGLNERSFKSGLLKGGSSALSGPNEDMDGLNQEMVSTLAADFLEEVYTFRQGRLTAPRETVVSGRIWTGPQALKIGLIDRVATMEELKATDFKDMKVHVFKPETAFAEGFSLRDAVTGAIRGSLTDLENPEIR